MPPFPIPERAANLLSRRERKLKFAAEHAPVVKEGSYDYRSAKTRKPKIVYLFPWKFDIGGAQKYVVLLSEHMNRRGAEVHIIARSPNVAYHLAEGVVFHVCQTDREARELLTALKPDIIHHQQPGEYSWGHCTDLATAGFVYTAHNPYCFDSLRSKTDVDKIVTMANPDRPEGAHMIEGAIDINVPRKIDFGNEVLRLGYVGRIREHKIPEAFCEAVKKWDHGPWKLCIVGAEDDKPHVEKLKAIFAGCEHVEWWGEVPPDKIGDVYPKLDAHISPATTESSSNSVIEASACGIPTVGMDAGGNSFMLPKEMLSTTFDGMLAAVRKLDPMSERKRIGNFMRKEAERRWDINLSNQKHEEFYRGLLGRELSVCLPVYKVPLDIFETCLCMLRNQTRTAFEVILIDDAASQDVKNIYERHAWNDFRFRIVKHEKNAGCTASIIDGVNASKSTYFARADADDWSHETRFEKEIDALRKNSGAGFCCTGFKWIGGGVVYPCFDPSKFNWKMYSPICHASTMIRRTSYEWIGGYRADHFYAQDYQLWAEFIASGAWYVWIEEVLVTRLSHAESETHVNRGNIMAHDTTRTKAFIENAQAEGRWNFHQITIRSEQTQQICPMCHRPMEMSTP